MQWHQLNHLQTICTLLQIDNHTNTSSLNFLQAEYSSWCPTTVSNHCRHFVYHLWVLESRDVNSWEIAFPGRESQFPGLDRDFRFRPSTYHLPTRSELDRRWGARGGAIIGRPPMLFPAHARTPSLPADNRHSRQWRPLNGSLSLSYRIIALH